MNDCPPNPGNTVMHSTRSTWSRNGSSASKGVSGLAARPTRRPRSRIWAISAAVSPTSTCTVQPSAPASRNGCRYRAGSVIIRWVSKNRSLWARSEATTGGPMVRLGTKWPSMTSTCSQSVPGATRPTASARLPKSADRMDGATRRVGVPVVGVSTVAIVIRLPGSGRAASGEAARAACPAVRGQEPSRSSGATWTPCSQSTASIGRLPSGWTVRSANRVPPPAPTSVPRSSPGPSGAPSAASAAAGPAARPGAVGPGRSSRPGPDGPPGGGGRAGHVQSSSSSWAASFSA